MMPLTRKILAAALAAACWSASAQSSQPEQALSPIELLVQSMGVAPAMQAGIRKSLADPAAVQRMDHHELAVGKKLVSLSESEFNGLVARVMAAGLPSADLATITDFYQTPLGKKLSEHNRKGTTLQRLNADLSDSERQAMERFASSGVTTRVIRFLESDRFERTFQAELEAFPAHSRP